MINDHNLKITEQEYRDLELPSYSLLASISKHGVDVINGIKSGGMFVLKFGSLVDDMCFNTQILSSKYYAGDSPKNPTTNVKNIIDELLNIINAPIGETNNTSGILGGKKSQIITDNLDDYQQEICDIATSLGVYKSYTIEKIMEAVRTGQDYFKDRLTSRGKILIKPEMWSLAYQTAETLITHDFSSKYFDHNQDGIEIFYQYKFVSQVRGKDCKGMLDCVLVDHNNKKIYLVDLKTGEAPAEKFNEVILIHKYYIQGALYREALKNIVANDPDLKGYSVEEFEFLYISKMNPYKPVIWVMPEKFHANAMNGFTDVFGYKHRGIDDLLNDYYNCKSGRYCDYTQSVYENEGRIMLEGIVKNENIEK